MNIFVAALSVGTLSVFLALGAAAQEPKTLTFLQNWYPAEDKCSEANTLQADLQALLAAPEEYEGRCVSVEGYYLARALFYKKTDLRRQYPSQNEAAALRRLGIYGPDALMDDLFDRDREFIRVTGLWSNCRNLHSEGTTMVMGYCHYTDGPIIGITSFETAHTPN